MQRKLVLSFIIVIFISTSACSGHRIKRDPSGIRSAVIFIPGYKGSILKKLDSEETVWLDASEILFGSRSLALVGDPVGIENRVAVRPDGLFKSFAILPWLYDYSVYNTWVDYLDERLPLDTEFVEFGYDWRLDNAENARRLAGIIDELNRRNISDIAVVSHSMGGLILAYYLRYGGQDPASATESWEGAKKIRKAIFAGTPFRGAIAIFRDLQRGNPTIINDELLSRDALGTFYSSYELLTKSEDQPFLAPDGQPGTLDIYDSALWERNNWGFLIPGISPEVRAARVELLRTRLARAALVSSLLHRRSDSAPEADAQPLRTKCLILAGTGLATAAHAVLGPEQRSLFFADDEVEKKLKGFDRSVFYKDGDGLVTVQSATLPAAYVERLGAELLTRNVEHSEFYNDPTFREIIVQFLRG